MDVSIYYQYDRSFIAWSDHKPPAVIRDLGTQRLHRTFLRLQPYDVSIKLLASFSRRRLWNSALRGSRGASYSVTVKAISESAFFVTGLACEN